MGLDDFLKDQPDNIVRLPDADLEAYLHQQGLEPDPNAIYRREEDNSYTRLERLDIQRGINIDRGS
jgi:hypothetical protein